MPNMMVALPNIGGALYSTPQSVADTHYYMPCSNAAKTRNQLKCGGVSQSNDTIRAAGSTLPGGIAQTPVLGLPSHFARPSAA